jgi:uncharacterized Fe-S cluster protein YjdI
MVMSKCREESSMRDDITKKYTNGEITVVWKPRLCTHSTRCWKGLISVFNPKERPWVNMNGATTDQIADQVNQCPSGALSYYKNDAAPAVEAEAPVQPSVTVEVSPNGPLLVTGDITLKLPDGTERQMRHKSSLCRCGQSANKPFCDSSHKKHGFTG